MKHILLSNLASKHSVVIKSVSLCSITKENFLSENFMKNVTWKLFPGPFYFSKNPLKKECEEVCMQIWTNFNSSAITCLIYVACFKNFIFQ